MKALTRPIIINAELSSIAVVVVETQQLPQYVPATVATAMCHATARGGRPNKFMQPTLIGNGKYKLDLPFKMFHFHLSVCFISYLHQN